MALVEATLADGLKGMTPTSDVSEAAENMASAWETYFLGASVSGVPVGGSLSAAKAAMKSALLGMSVPGSGAAAIAAGITAFWGVVVPAAATLWTLPPPAVVTVATPPPTLGALTAAITGVFAANTSGSLSKDDSATALATVLHASGGLGGIAMVTIAPAGPAPTPIL